MTQEREADIIAAEAVRQWNAAGNAHLSTGAIGVARIAAELALRSGGEGWRPEEGSGYATGFKAGVLEAARTLSEAAEVHRLAAQDSRKVVEINGHKFAECLLASWANGLEINASRALPAPSPSTHGEG